MCLRVNVKCYTYGFEPAKCVRKTILEERYFEGTVMQIEKALINDRLRVSKVS